MSKDQEIQKWGTYTAEAAQEEREALQDEGGADFMKLSVGRNIVRILPPARGRSSPFRVTYQHYVETPDGKWAFTCPRLENDRRCLLCELAMSLQRSGKPRDRDQGYQIKAKRRVYTNAINRADPDKGPVVLAFGKTIHDDLVNLREDEVTGGDYTHPVGGIDVIIDRVGSGKNDTEYTVNLSRQTSPLHPDATVMDSWAGMLHDLDSFAKVPSDDEMNEKMNEIFGVSAAGPPGGGEVVDTTGGPAAYQDQQPRPRPAAQQQQPRSRAAAQPRRARTRTAQDDVQQEQFEATAEGGDGGDSNEAWGMDGGDQQQE